jgi:acyl carrier protein
MKKHPYHAVTCAMTVFLGSAAPAQGKAFALLALKDLPGQIGPVRTEANPSSQADPRVPERLRNLFVNEEAFMVKENEFTYDARFVEDLGFDSLKTVQCVGVLEEEFRIDIPDEDAEKFLRVRDVVEYLKTRKVID